MANVTIGNSNLAQNHPRIISVVSNNAEVNQSSNSGLKMFTALISEKGPEDVRTISSQNELISLYGALDMNKYGQAGYNAQNWLQAGGQVVVRRVLPDDAAYAHAFINVRTKKVGDKIAAETLISSVAGASTMDTIETILSKDRPVGTGEAKDHLLVVFTPVGRGESYDNIGFRMYSNKQYDNFLNYRAYNFEVVQFLDNGSVNIIEGPFAVSLNRDALSPVNNESMFIEDVLVKYSETLRAKVNEEALIEVCKEICPALPLAVDPIFFETRIINGAEEQSGGKDVHDAVSSIADAGDEITRKLIEIDDKYAREAQKFESETRLAYMAELIEAARKSGETGTPIVKQGTDTIEEAMEAVARAEVAGKACATQKAACDRYMKAKIAHEKSVVRAELGGAELDAIKTACRADAKELVNARVETKAAFVQEVAIELKALISKLEISEIDLSDLDNAVAEATNRFATEAAKKATVDALLALQGEGALVTIVGAIVDDAKAELDAEKEAEAVLESVSWDFGDVKASDVAAMIERFEEAEKDAKAEKGLFVALEDIKMPVRLRDGSDGEFGLEHNARERQESIDRHLVNLYNGLIEPLVTSVKLCPFNFILDANYPQAVKNAIVNLATNIRRDFVFIADCGLNANAKGDLAFRREFNVSSNYVAIYGQNEIIYDAASGRDVKVTTPNILATKLPVLENTVGLQNPIAGSRRGVVSGFKSINYLPTETEQEDLYNNRVNYIVGDATRYNLGSQLTSDFSRTPLSDLNNVITMLNIKREAERAVEKYQFEFLDSSTMRTMQQDINLILSNYIGSNSIDSGSCTVYASEYDALQHIVRVNISIKFKDIIETVIITLEVTR